jgi:hypothetical protein
LKGGRAGLKAPVNIVQNPFDHQLLVSPDAFPAEDALAHIPLKERITIIGREVLGHGIQENRPQSQFSGHTSEPAAVPLVANNAGFRMTGQHEPDDGPAAIQDPRGMGLKYHPGGNGRYAGGQQDTPALFFHQTDPAGPGRWKMRVMAKGWDRDSQILGQLQDSHSGLTTYSLLVDLYGYGTHGIPLC